MLRCFTQQGSIAFHEPNLPGRAPCPSLVTLLILVGMTIMLLLLPPPPVAAVRRRRGPVKVRPWPKVFLLRGAAAGVGVPHAITLREARACGATAASAAGSGCPQGVARLHGRRSFTC